MMDSDRDYFERRKEECLAKAANAADPALARIHREFAAQYERKLKAGRSTTLRSVTDR